MLWWTFKQLKSADSNKRQQAAQKLGESKDARAVEPLVAALNDEEYFVRKEAVIALSKIGDERAVEPLVAALKDKDSSVRKAVAEALSKIGEPAVEPLAAALKDDEASVCRAATEALGLIGDARAVEPLVAALVHTDADARQAAANALDRIDPKWPKSEAARRAVPILVGAFKDKEWSVRQAVANELGRIGDTQGVAPLEAALHDNAQPVRRAAAEALGLIGDVHAIEPLIDAFSERRTKALLAKGKFQRSLWPPGESTVLQAVANALNRISPEWAKSERAKPAIASLFAALNNSNPDVWLPAMETLERIDRDWAKSEAAQQAVPMLNTALSHQDSDVRWVAVNALDRITPNWAGSKATREALPRLLGGLQDSDWRARHEAAAALGKLGHPLAVDGLVAALKDEARNAVAAVAARALGEISSARAVQPLVWELKNVDESVRQNAAEALGKIADVTALEPLVAILNDEDSSVRREAAAALKLIDPNWGKSPAAQRAVPALVAELSGKSSGRAGRTPRTCVVLFVPTAKVESYEVRRAAANALGEIGNTRAVEPLEAALRDNDPTVREAAAKALGKAGDLHAIDALVSALVDEYSDVVKAATEALGSIGDARAVEPLVGLLHNEEFTERCKAAEALGQIGNTRAVEPLLAALKDAKSSVRADAAKALGKIADARAVEPLVDALQDESVWVPTAAAEALEKIPLNPEGEARRAQALASWREGKANAGKRSVEMEPLDGGPSLYAADSVQTAKHTKEQGSRSDAGGTGSPQKAVVCCICGASMVGQPIMQDRLTGAVYCQDDAEYFHSLKDPGAFSPCPWCGFKYSAKYSSFAKGLPAICPNCRGNLRSAIKGGPTGLPVSQVPAREASLEARRNVLDPYLPKCSFCSIGLLERSSFDVLHTEILEDMTMFWGAVCKKCVTLICQECLRTVTSACPNCGGNLESHIYREHLKRLKQSNVQMEEILFPAL